MRRRYLDWLRGIAVLIMIEAHTIDAWTRAADRGQPLFAWGLVLGGFGAPLFLFLAGISISLASGARMRKGLSVSEAAARARRRGWQIFGLAFLFRLQSWIISRGDFAPTLLKVDILNIMGPSMVAAAAIWGMGRTQRTRALLLVVATCALAMLTPIVRASPVVGLLPDPVEWYLRPFPGHTTFTLFPWSGFLLAGAVVGLVLDRAQQPRDEARVNLAFVAIGGLIAAAGYAASWLPPIYPETSFWTSSPTFFFLRLGILITAVPLAYAWGRARVPLFNDWSPLEQFGVASLFVYWIHVEMVYGTPSGPLHHRLTLQQWPIAYVLFTAFLFALVRLKSRLTTMKASRGTGDADAEASALRA